MSCPAPSDDLSIQSEDVIRSLKADLPFLKCDPAAKNTVQLLLNRIDELTDLQDNHDEFSRALLRRKDKIITGLIDIIETGIHNHDIMRKARQEVRRDTYHNR